MFFAAMVELADLPGGRQARRLILGLMAELVYAYASGAYRSNPVEVQVLFSPPKMFFVYVLISKVDNNLYIGQTTNLEKRLKEHNSGKTKSIKHRIPFKIIYFEKAENRKEAREKELKFKSHYMREKFKKINADVVERYTR